MLVCRRPQAPHEKVYRAQRRDAGVRVRVCVCVSSLTTSHTLAMRPSLSSTLAYSTPAALGSLPIISKPRNVIYKGSTRCTHTHTHTDTRTRALHVPSLHHLGDHWLRYVGFPHACWVQALRVCVYVCVYVCVCVFYLEWLAPQYLVTQCGLE